MAIIWTKLIPRWGGDTIEPPEGKKDTGYIAGDKPPAKWENWLRKGTYEALDETRDVIEGIDSQLAQIGEDLDSHKSIVFGKTFLITEPYAQVTKTTVNLGFRPKSLTIDSCILGTKYESIGYNDGTATFAKYTEVTTNNKAISGLGGVVFYYNQTNTLIGYIALTDTGFEIVWTLTGTLTDATGNRRLLIQALNH